jgi:hypothetical protein
MARKTTWGTPSRSEHYVPLRPRFVFIKWGLILIGAALGLGVLFLFLPASWGLRSLVSPGSVAKAHADFEASCQNCHKTRGGLAERGVSNIRCERCHDAAAGGTLSLAAHLRMARPRPRQDVDARPARFEDQDCSVCHIEHRGLAASLKLVDEAHCRQCHFSFGSHPDFYYVREKQQERTGFVFNHQAHFTEKGLKRFKKATAEDTCGECHKPNDQNDDFFPITYDPYCISCHSMLAQPKLGHPMEPVPANYVLSPNQAGARPEEFDQQGELIVKTVAERHPDRWVERSIQKLWREAYPDRYEAERSRLARQKDRLERRLALLQPLSSQSDDDLGLRAAALTSELQYYEGRLRKATEAALDAGPGLDRLQPVLDALVALDPNLRGEATGLQARIATLRGEKSTAGLPAREFEEQRQQLLAWLDRLEGLDPGLKGRLILYRRRVDALLAGETTVEMLSRVRDQRARELQRIEDELDLRADVGLYRPPPAERQRRERPFRDALTAVEARLDTLPPADGALAAAAELEAKRRALPAIVRACDYCHVFTYGMQERVAAALPVLKRSKFKHEPHLRLRDCLACHPGLKESERAEELHLTSLQTCRECHNSRQGKTECRMCHLYHPVEAP